MLYTNAQRPGAVMNMTIGEVRAAEAVNRCSTTFFRIRVWEHKTTASFGSAAIVVPLGIYTMLKSYIECVRREGEDEDLVFLTNNGNPLTKAGHELENLASSLKEELPLTPSLNRKILATTAAANLEDDQLRVVANHMTHDVKTAARYYYIQRDAETAMDAYQLLNTSVSKVLFLTTRHE